MSIEGGGLVVLRMNRKSAYADHICHLQRSS